MDKFDAQIEQETRRKYSGENGEYKPETISHLPDAQSKDFSQQLLCIKFNLVRNIAPGAVILDLGCGNGAHAIELAKIAKKVYGVDYSPVFVTFAENAARSHGMSNVQFSCENARAMSFDQDMFDVVYSFAALYHMPALQSVFSEIVRVLKPGGSCVLELGNSRSLNSIVCRHYPELATGCHITVKEMVRTLQKSGLVIRQHSSFQLLPMWADRPSWMRLLLHPSLRRIMAWRLHGHMLDEWACKLPILSNFAFRHVFVCNKPRQT